ncbi:MAG: LuxR C-terminal-related transcriptional regulator [Chthoniobacterales bacterium]
MSEEEADSLAEHQAFLTPEISEIVFRRFVYADKSAPPPPSTPELTPREREIMRLLAEGRSNKEIATALEIGGGTTETHRATMLRKLGLDSLAALVRSAIRNHIIEA